MAVEIEALELSISHESKGATNSIGKLVSALTNLRRAASGGAGLNQVVSQLKQLHQALSASSATGAAQSLSATQKSAASAAAAVQQASRQVTELSSEYSSVQSSAASAASAMGGATAETKNAASATGKVASTAKSASQATKELARETKNAGSAAKNSSGFFSKFARSLGRVMFYRAIRTALRLVVQAIKEGVTNLYYYSQAVNNTDTAQAANTMDAYASAILRVKNSIGAALMPIIQAALPLVQTLTYAIVTALNFFNKFVSALTGHSTYTYAAADATTSFASSLGGAAGAAKELRKQLNIMGFDELNILEEPDPSSGGGGGGGSATPPYSEMFETAPIEPEFLQKMKEWLEPIETAINNIKSAWDKFANSKLGQDVIDAFKFLGNLALSEAIERVGDAINFVADALELVTMIFDPEQFDLSKFLGLSGDMLETIGESSSLPTYLGFSFANKLLGNLFGKEDGLMSDEWVRRLAEIATPGGGLGTLGELLGWTSDQLERGEDSWLYGQTRRVPVGDERGPGKNGGRIAGGSKGSFIVTPFGAIYYNPFYGSLGEMDKKPNLDMSFWEWLGFGTGNDSEGAGGDNPIGDWFEENVAPWFTKKRWQKLGTDAKAAFKKTFVWKAINAVSEWYSDKVQPWFTKEKWQSIGTSAISGFKNTFVWKMITAVSEWFQTKVSPWFTAEKWQGLGTKAINWFKGTFLWNKITSIATWYQTNVQPYFTKEKWKQISTNAVTWFKGTFLWDKVTSVATWYQTNVQPWFTKEKWQTTATNAVTWFKGTFVWTKMTEIGTWFSTKVSPYFTREKWRTFGANAINWFRGAFSLDFDAIGTWFETKVKPWFTWQKWYNLGKDALNALVDGIKKIHIPTFHLEWGSVSWLNGTKLEWLKVPKLSFYAEGGYGIPNGQLFMANEAGPELVGQMNGRNTVANQGQIVEGIRQGVYDAVVSAFANNGGQSNHITVKVGDGTLADVVTRALNNQTRRLGYSQLEGI